MKKWKLIPKNILMYIVYGIRGISFNFRFYQLPNYLIRGVLNFNQSGLSCQHGNNVASL